jgi:hypothetical protein
MTCLLIVTEFMYAFLLTKRSKVPTEEVAETMKLHTYYLRIRNWYCIFYVIIFPSINFITSRGTISIWRRILLHVVR